MKKIISLMAIFVLMLSFCLPASGEGSTVTLVGSDSVTVGSNIKLIVKVSGCPAANKVAGVVSYGDGFEAISGTWLKNGQLKQEIPNTFTDHRKNQVGLGGLHSNDINGDLFELVLKAKTASKDLQSVSVNVIVYDKAGAILTNTTPSKSIKISCASHSYGAFTKKDEINHTRTCSVCGNAETAKHTWKEEVTKAASCKEAGTKTLTCAVCNAAGTEAIAKTGDHKFANPTVTKQPTCTETGIETGKCTVCGKETTKTIKSLDHSFGNWSDTKAAACTEKGMQERKCSRCNAVEKREVAALGHDFESPVIVKQATLTEKGLEEGVCKRCGEKAQSEIPCTYKDETTGMVLNPEEGAFETGTAIKISIVGKESGLYATLKKAIGRSVEDFTAYDLAATLNNAAVQPRKPVKVSFDIPEGYGKNAAIFFLFDDGSAEQLDSTVSGDGKTVSATVSQLGSFATVKLSDNGILTQPDEISAAEIPATNFSVADETTTKSSGEFPWTIAVIAIILIGTVIAVIFINKKNRNSSD